MTSETSAQRLGRLVRARRKALKLTQADVQKADGPSTATQRLIEGGKHTDFRGGTGSGLESALQWQPGSIDAILAGGDPTPLSSAPQQVRDTSDDRDHHVLELLPVAEMTWRYVNELADSPDGDPLRWEKSARAVIATADTLTDALLRAKVGPEARPLIQEMSHQSHQALLRAQQIHAENEGEKDALEDETPAGASGEAHQKQEVKPEPPSKIETALGDHWAESVDWSTIRTPADVQRLVLELAEEALKMHGQVDLDLNDFAAKIRNYADALRREQDAEQSDEVNEVTQSHFDLAARTVDDEGKPI